MLYGQQAVVPLEFLLPSLDVATINNMIECGAIEERISQLMEIEEDRILTRFFQEVQNGREKAWNDKNIKKKSLKEGDLVLLYENKFFQHLGKFRMRWLGPYEIQHVTDGGSMRLKDLIGIELKGMINGS